MAAHYCVYREPLVNEYTTLLRGSPGARGFMGSPKLDLAELIDLELQFDEDHRLTYPELRERDRAIGRQIRHSIAAGNRGSTDRAALFREWLQRVRSGTGFSPGQRIAQGLRLAGLVLVLAGLASGWGAATACLRYSGDVPVNVTYFIGVFVVLQLLLFVFLLLNIVAQRILFARAAASVIQSGIFKDVVHFIVHRRTLAARGKDLHKTAGIGHTVSLQHLHRLYAPLERWLLTVLTQRFGIAFNVAAMATLLWSISFADFAFCWSTTLKVDPLTVHKLVSVLAAPWSWISEGLVPGLDVIRHTEYNRHIGHYILEPPADMVKLTGAWWPFLLMSLGCYGLLPRLGVLIAAKIGYLRTISSQKLDSIDCTSLYLRLSEALDTSYAQEGLADADPTGQETAPAFAPLLTGPCSVVLWRDIPADRGALDRLLKETFRQGASVVVQAGGKALDLDAEQAASTVLESTPEDGPLILIVEAWEAPAKAIKRFITGLRSRLGPKRPFLVVPVELQQGQLAVVTQGRDVHTWRTHIARMGDPWTGVVI